MSIVSHPSLLLHREEKHMGRLPVADGGLVFAPAGEDLVSGWFAVLPLFRRELGNFS